jgi:hypothetical protein
MVIFLDALDQLATSPGSEAVAWLPTWLPDGARLVVSSIADARTSALRNSLGRTNTLALDSMPVEESDALLDSWLAAAGRRLQPPQRQTVTRAFQGRRLPLSLKLVFETVRLWSSFDEPEALATDAPALFRAFLRRLSDDGAHGERLVSRALGFLAAARHGLAEDEILDLLSPDVDPTVMADFRRRSPRAPQTDRLPIVVWSRLFFDIEPYLSARRADGATLLGFYHRTLLDVVNEDYLSGEAGRDIRERIAAYFQRKPLHAGGEINARKLSEEPHALTRAGGWAALFSCLTDLLRLELVASRRDESSGSAAGIGQIEADFSLALELWPADAADAEREALAQLAAAIDADGDLFSKATRPDRRATLQSAACKHPRPRHHPRESGPELAFVAYLAANQAAPAPLQAASSDPWRRPGRCQPRRQPRSEALPGGPGPSIGRATPDLVPPASRGRNRPRARQVD